MVRADKAMAAPAEFEDLAEYFPALANDPTAVQRFLAVTSQDEYWCVVHPQALAAPRARDDYAGMMREPAQFVMDLLQTFHISPVCRVCAKQDQRTTYPNHVCGREHHTQVWHTREGSKQGEAAFWQHWIFILGEVRINYITGELLMKRCRSSIGLNVKSLLELPSDEVWYCVGTEVAIPLQLPEQATCRWWENFPSISGGRGQWKRLMQKPAQRLNDLLANHHIHGSVCSICGEKCALWPEQLTGPQHYKTLSNLKNDLKMELPAGPRRFQDWDLPIGKLRFDHFCGGIYMLRCRDRQKLRSTEFPMAEKLLWQAGEHTELSRKRQAFGCSRYRMPGL